MNPRFKNKTGRPPFVPTPEILEKIADLAELGAQQQHIARALGMHPSTFIEHKKAYPEMEQAMEEGRLRGIMFLLETSRNIIINKERERAQELERLYKHFGLGKNDEPQVVQQTINNYQTMPTEELLKTIEQQRTNSGETLQ